MGIFATLITNELRLALRQGSSSGMVVAFFLVTASLYPLAVGPAPGTLALIAPGILWVSALLASLLSLERLFHMDIEDGFMDQLALAPWPMELIVFAKIAAHWLTSAVPLILAAPVLAILLQLDDEAIPVLVLSMVIGTPALSFIGAIGAGLTSLVKRGSMLLSLLILPLYAPTLIFGVLAVDAVLTGGDSTPHLMLLGAISLLATALAPFAAAASIRLALE
jgi:heme exporter protein B